MTQKFTIVFGLTADPIHLGHEQAIINSIDYLISQDIDIERFTLIPVYQPHLIAGKKSPIASFTDRYKMCDIVAKRLSSQLACTIDVSDIEKKLALKTNKVNFSFNTIKSFNQKNLLFMASADHFQGRWPKFRKWYKWQELLTNCGLLINQRPGNTINMSFIKQLKKINPAIFIVNSDKTVNTSSTKIRFDIERAFTDECLSKDIIEFLKQNRLYQ